MDDSNEENNIGYVTQLTTGFLFLKEFFQLKKKINFHKTPILLFKKTFLAIIIIKLLNKQNLKMQMLEKLEIGTKNFKL